MTAFGRTPAQPERDGARQDGGTGPLGERLFGGNHQRLIGATGLDRLHAQHQGFEAGQEWRRTVLHSARA